MRLDPEQRQRVEHWLKERGVRDCPTCGLSDFYVGQLTSEPIMVQVICQNCAHVLLFEAQALGLIR